MAKEKTAARAESPSIARPEEIADPRKLIFLKTRVSLL